MLTPQELERAGMLLDPQMHELEERIMSDIIRRIRINGEITSSADWQIHRLYELGMSKREIKKIIKETLDLSPAEISHMYKQVLRSGYARSRELYKAKGAPWIPFDKNTGLQQLINAVSVQTAGTLQNITQSLGFATRVGGKLAYLPVADYYQKTLDAAMYDIASGAFDYNTVLKRTVREMTNSGLRTIDYASGWANRVEVAARRAIMTGMGQLTAKINEDNAKALETDWFEITWHSGFRPEHDWGGKWFRRPDLVRVCGLGSVTGLCGANCYHDYYPVIPGISVPLYTDEQLKAMNEAEQKPVEWKGKTYTKYEATQRQRHLETTMRAQRQEMRLLKEGGADEDDLINLRARYRATSQEYARFSEAAGLPQQRERVSVDGLGNIMQGKYTGGSGKESPVKLPPVGAKRGTPVPDAERSELPEHLTSGAGSSTQSPPYTDVLDEYMKNATPGVGTITRDSDYIEGSHKEEIEFADWLHKKLGGDIHIQQEHRDKQYPDYTWCGKLWELKSPESQDGTNSALRKGYNQISENPGGVILNYGKHEIDTNFVLEAIRKRMKWYKGDTMDIMIVHRGEIVKILRYKKR